jgi:hypothetical protein
MNERSDALAVLTRAAGQLGEMASSLRECGAVRMADVMEDEKRTLEALEAATTGADPDAVIGALEAAVVASDAGLATLRQMVGTARRRLARVALEG